MPLSAEQRQAVLTLLDQGIDNVHTIEDQTGVPWQSVAAIKARRKPIIPEESETTEVLDAIETTFGLERDLQIALRANIDQLEPGLVITDGGKEQIVKVGKIDITAKDRSDAIVVIELKTGLADHNVFGQILSYMGDLSEPGKTVRGIIVAGDFSARAVTAARAVPNIRLRRYTFQFSFEDVSSIIAMSGR